MKSLFQLFCLSILISVQSVPAQGQKGALCETPYRGITNQGSTPSFDKRPGVNYGCKVPRLTVANIYCLMQTSVIDWKLQINRWSDFSDGPAPKYEDGGAFKAFAYYTEGDFSSGMKNQEVYQWKPANSPGYMMTWTDPEPLRKFEESLRDYFCYISQTGDAVYQFLIDDDLVSFTFGPEKGGYFFLATIK